MVFGFKQPLVGEKRCMMTLITTAEETNKHLVCKRAIVERPVATRKYAEEKKWAYQLRHHQCMCLQSLALLKQFWTSSFERLLALFSCQTA